MEAVRVCVPGADLDGPAAAGRADESLDRPACLSPIQRRDGKGRRTRWPGGPRSGRPGLLSEITRTSRTRDRAPAHRRKFVLSDVMVRYLLINPAAALRERRLASGTAVAAEPDSAHYLRLHALPERLVRQLVSIPHVPVASPPAGGVSSRRSCSGAVRPWSGHHTPPPLAISIPARRQPAQPAPAFGQVRPHSWRSVALWYGSTILSRPIRGPDGPAAKARAAGLNHPAGSAV